MNKILLILGIVLTLGIVYFVYTKTKSASAAKSTNTAPAGGNNPNPQGGSSGGVTGKVDIIAGSGAVREDFLGGLNNAVTNFFGGTLGLTSRFANYGEVSASMSPVGKYMAVENDVSVTNKVTDKVKFSVIFQVLDSSGIVQALQRQTLELEPKQTTTIGFYAPLFEKGSYRVETLFWTSLTDPSAVADKLTKTVQVTG